jgi:hypothetical protein
MRPIFWYLAFVGVPVLALLGILRLGEGLVAPRAVHGTYAVGVDSSSVALCFAPLLAGAERRMTVVQSGTRLQLTFGQTPAVVLTGTIAGDTIRAAAAKSCLTADSIALSATVRRTPPEGELVGQLEARGCSACPPAPFRARLLPTKARDGGA